MKYALLLGKYKKENQEYCMFRFWMIVVVVGFAAGLYANPGKSNYFRYSEKISEKALARVGLAIYDMYGDASMGKSMSGLCSAIQISSMQDDKAKSKQPHSSNSINFELALSGVQFGTKVRVYATNGTVILGRFSYYKSPIIYLWPLKDTDKSLLIPISYGRVDKITYSKPIKGWWLLSFVGLAAGVELGIAGNDAWDTHNDRIGFDISGITINPVVFGGFGFALGAVLGHQIHTTATIRCR
jgi:hypothetical protein